MEESNERLRVVPELYFLMAKFLSGGPLKETAKTFLKELERVQVLPRRLDWEGNEHTQSYNELNSQFHDLPWDRLATVCEAALRLAQSTPSLSLATAAEQNASSLARNASHTQLSARLSLLSDSLVRTSPKYSIYKQDHSLIRRILHRELGNGPAAIAGGRGGLALFPPRLLSGLQLQRRTLGHLSAVYCLVFDCTGRYVITGADDLLVKVWSAIDGRLVCTLRGAGAEITDVCVSSDGALLACGSVERLVRVWCLETAAPRAVLHAHIGTITSVHWAPTSLGDVRWLASTSTDGSVAFWSCSRDGQFLSQPVQYVERLRPGPCHMICAAWSAGGALLAAGSADHHVRVYSVKSLTRVLETAVHTDAVDSLAWAHRGLRFVSGSKDGCAALWTLHATQWRHTLLKCSSHNTDDTKRLKVTMVCWDRSDEYVMTAVSDKTVRVWCARTCQQIRTLSGHRDEAYVLEAHPFLPAVFLSAGHDGQLFVWHAAHGEVLAHFHNHIDGQGDGAIFDAKWGGGAHIAASDSHGHLLLLGLGQGHKRLKQLPTELFFHTDYRPLVRDALGGALDEQTELPPHLMTAPFLVDVEGAPHPPHFQRLVPGREHQPLAHLIPANDAARSRIDAMIEALAGDRSPSGAGVAGEGRGPWRGEGVRHTAGVWQSEGDICISCRPIVPPLSPAAKEALELASTEMLEAEMSWYRREMRRRPLMISTAGGDTNGRRPGRRPKATTQVRPQRPSPQRVPAAVNEELRSVEDTEEETWDDSPRLSNSQHSTHSSSVELSEISGSQSGSGSDTSDSSQYSDWEAGAALAPPARARRRPLAKRHSPNVTTPNKTPGPSEPGPATKQVEDVPELLEAYRPGEWLTAVSPRKAPYHPQMGDRCLYFRLGHQRYFEAVSEKDLYKVNPRDKPWERTHVYECEVVKVVGIKYVIKPPRVVCLKLACSLPPTRSFTVRYHDMPDVIDFLVLSQQYATAIARRWSSGHRFRCMIDDSWWTGVVLENTGRGGELDSSHCPLGVRGVDSAQEWAAAAASHFLSLRVRWDNGEVERLSPWDLEPIDPERLPSEPGGSVAVLPSEVEAVLYRADPDEWPPEAGRAIASHINQVMSLSVAEPFVAPVDLQLYPSYAMVVPYPIDLATIRARFENLFYRRLLAAQFDVRYLASNAEQFNDPHSTIVRQARLVTDLLLHIINNWRNVDVVAKYHELAASYHSSDDEPLAVSAKSRSRKTSHREEWKSTCSDILRELMSSADAEPFREPVSVDQAPDYHDVVQQPMDLGTVRARLTAGEYSHADQFANDVRLVFSNSRLYNTNKRSRIYSMTVRLSSLFEALWSRVPVRAHTTSRRTRMTRTRTRTRTRNTRTRTSYNRHMNGGVSGAGEVSSESEPLAASSRRWRRSGEPAGPSRRADSWDSDAPLHSHRKGKGIGKKSKTEPPKIEPVASTSAASNNIAPPQWSERRVPHNGLQDTHSNTDDDEWISPRRNQSHRSTEEHQHKKIEKKLKRRRKQHSSSSEQSQQESHVRRGRHRAKRAREHFSEWSSSSSGCEEASGSGRRYESDRSYRPLYSTDDDAPLQLYRQRQDSGDRAGPSTLRIRKPHKRKVLRVRGPRRYNEESESDSAAAISKRARPPGQHAAAPRPHIQVLRRTRDDHDYFRDEPPPQNGTTAVSISSRGRVRKLTAKARGLLRP